LVVCSENVTPKATRNSGRQNWAFLLNGDLISKLLWVVLLVSLQQCSSSVLERPQIIHVYCRKIATDVSLGDILRHQTNLDQMGQCFQTIQLCVVWKGLKAASGNRESNLLNRLKVFFNIVGLFLGISICSLAGRSPWSSWIKQQSNSGLSDKKPVYQWPASCSSRF